MTSEAFVPVRKLTVVRSLNARNGSSASGAPCHGRHLQQLSYIGHRAFIQNVYVYGPRLRAPRVYTQVQTADSYACPCPLAVHRIYVTCLIPATF